MLDIGRRHVLDLTELIRGHLKRIWAARETFERHVIVIDNFVFVLFMLLVSVFENVIPSCCCYQGKFGNDDALGNVGFGQFTWSTCWVLV